MKIRYMCAAVLAAAAFAAPLHAQDTTAKKPGGINKVAHDVSSTAKKAGRDAKAEVHRDASKTHDALTTAGNETKTAAGNATGIHRARERAPQPCGGAERRTPPRERAEPRPAPSARGRW